MDLGSAGTFTSTQTLTVTGSGETLCVEGISDSGNMFSADMSAGLRNRDCSGWSPILATGGDRTYTIDVNGVTYRVHEYTTPGEAPFNITEPGSTGDVEFLVVAGGGGGGSGASSGAGGGGGGGFLTGETSLQTSTAWTITVGDGGQGAAIAYLPGTNGDNSSIGDIVVAVGGGGGGSQFVTGGGSVGGSGGGGAGRSTNPTGGAGTTGQGNSGGDGRSTNQSYDPGGGGGGAGLASTITGQNVYYAGGGGGGTRGNPFVGGLGGQGGGQGGLDEVPAESGDDGLGGGGGGDGRSNSSPGYGGSGIVILRYPLTNPG